MDGTSEKYDFYRQRCVDFIEQNREDFEPFIEDGSPFAKYCEKMRKNTVWGGNIEIQALSRLLNVSILHRRLLLSMADIVIHQVDAPRWEVNNWPKDYRTIHLSYVLQNAIIVKGFGLISAELPFGNSAEIKRNPCTMSVV